MEITENNQMMGYQVKFVPRVAFGRFLLVSLVTALLSAGALLAAQSAHAITGSITSPATINLGHGRTVAMNWSGVGPYNVNAYWNHPGIVNYIRTATPDTSTSRYLSYACGTGTPFTSNHNFTATDATNASVGGTSWTRWVQPCLS